MGWGRGSEIMDKILTGLDDFMFVTYDARVEFFKRMIEVFEDSDCDTLYECVGKDLAFDEAYNELHPDSEEE